MAAIADTDNKIVVSGQMTPALHVCTHVVAHPLQHDSEISQLEKKQKQNPKSANSKVVEENQSVNFGRTFKILVLWSLSHQGCTQHLTFA